MVTKNTDLKVASEEHKFSTGTLLYSAAPAINFLARKPKLFFRSRPLAQTFSDCTSNVLFWKNWDNFIIWLSGGCGGWLGEQLWKSWSCCKFGPHSGLCCSSSGWAPALWSSSFPKDFFNQSTTTLALLVESNFEFKKWGKSPKNYSKKMLKQKQKIKSTRAPLPDHCNHFWMFSNKQKLDHLNI